MYILLQMERAAIERLLHDVKSGVMSVEAALQALRDLPFSDLGFAKIDRHRSLRKNLPEVIFCPQKDPAHILAIVRRQRAKDETVFGTRASKDVIAAVGKMRGMEVDPIARCFWWRSPHWRPCGNVRGSVVIASGGTADAAVAAEALRTLQILGHPCSLIQDVGVAGIHRLFAHTAELNSASVIIAIAGMEGALPSVIAGLVACPVIGVPTSVGYGSHMGGMVPLLAMLNSCATGLTVVNVDNGFGAACAAAAINTVIQRDAPTNGPKQLRPQSRKL